MKTSLVSGCAVATLATALTFWYVARPSPTQHVEPPAHAEGAKLLARLAVAFVPNVGQWDSAARFVARIGAMTVLLEERGWTFTLVERSKAKEDENVRGVAVRMTFAGASEPEFVTEEQLPGRHNYFLGNDAAKWRSDVPLYRAVRYREVHRGIDVRAREQDGHFEYDLLLQPDAELEPMEVAVEGVERMHLDEEHALVLETRLGPVRMPAPLSWEEGPSGERSLVTCRYVLRGENRFGFDVTDRRAGWALVVDPGLVWSTFLGGAVFDNANAIALDAQGAVTVAGSTWSIDFPTTPGAFDTSFNDGIIDVFVTRLSPTGASLVYSTFLGGTLGDWGQALALDGQGAVTVTGYTNSTDFPTTPGAFDTSFNGVTDAFITRLGPSGASLVYSTFLGGTGVDEAHAIALDAQGTATVVGTGSFNFPTTLGAYAPTHGGGIYDAVVTRLLPTGASLVYSTFLGGTGDEKAFALALNEQGEATVAGRTRSTNFPTTPGAFDTSHAGLFDDAFVTRLSPTGASLVYSTFLGGVGIDEAHAVALDAQGAVTVAGRTTAIDFPTTPGAYDTTHNPGADYDAFVTRISPTGSSLIYSTFLGGQSGDEPYAIALDAQGAVTVAGLTSSLDFPTTPGAFATNHIFGGMDAFVSRLSPSGSRLVYSTFLLGRGSTQARAVALDAQGMATVAGYTTAADYPTTSGAFARTFSGLEDAFITRLDMLPTGVAAFGRSSPGCTGPLVSSVTSMPRVGNGGFGLTCGNAPPSTAGALVLAASGLTTPIPLLGVEVWLDPFSAFFISFSASSNSIGASEFALPIPNDPTLVGLKLDAQFFWGGPTSPPPCPPLGLSASNTLDITIQA